MPREILLETIAPVEFVTVPDPETQLIFISDPADLLSNLFRDDPNKIFLLDGSGFSMSKQIETWIKGYRSALANSESLEAQTRLFIDQTISDITGFYYEYLSGQDIFPIMVDVKENKFGQRTVLATEYDAELTNLALPEERNGALAQGVKRAVEMILESGPETIVMLDSPKGWSGLTQNGQPIIYPDNQLYVYFIDKEGDLRGITIRTDIDLDSGEKIIGRENKNAPEQERIMQVVRSPLSRPATSIFEALDDIEKVTGRRFDKQRRELADMENLFRLNGEAKRIVDGLKNYLVENISHLSLENIKVFASAVGKAILDLHKQVLKEQNKSVVYNYVNDGGRYQNSGKSGMEMYHQLAKDVSRLRGCNGGGQSLAESSVGSSQIGQMQIESNIETCKVCGTTAGVVCGWCKSCWELFGDK